MTVDKILSLGMLAVGGFLLVTVFRGGRASRLARTLGAATAIVVGGVGASGLVFGGLQPGALLWGSALLVGIAVAGLLSARTR